MRELISTGSPWETKVGYSRAVIVNDTIYISGTAGKGSDVYMQTRDALATVEKVLVDNGFQLSDVVQSRLVVADFDHWEDAARAHGEVYRDIRPAFSLVHALPFVDDAILAEVEAVAVRVAK
ncbi:endoribonuclease L-PSP [Burkholderia aenigmatica]|uniref:Endoribonuclease L-PSP n=1 Tax=Burkholderia aenigmatica TaxID=2015348 RepID=A0A6P2IBE5_9BURK|nr:RidA family protein [Burkholderia aenigmatica]VWB26844.1 endoribonuclease L-PSP [Burkholderia aenigmatica]